MPKHRATPTLLTRRKLLHGGGALLALGTGTLAYGRDIIAVRVWPAEDYTRVTIEADRPLTAHYQLVNSPPRLALDVQDLKLGPTLQELVDKVAADDPNLAGIRVGQYEEDVVRLVLDLKHEIKPQVFGLKPVAAYQYRLIFDLYPAHPADPLEELIAGRLGEPGAGDPAPGASVEHTTDTDELGALIARQIERASGQTELLEAPDEQVAAAPPAPGKQPGDLAAFTPRPPATQPTQPARPAPPPARQSTRRLIIVAVDPGHGGEDPGAIGPGGTYEKNVVLQIALRLRDRINRSSVGGNPMRAYLTRDGDYFVPLATRVQKARQVQADLFVSIHADSAPGSGATGASVYALSQRGASSTTARWLANRENMSDRIGGVNSAEAAVHQALLDMSTTVQIRDSVKLGHAVLGHVRGIGKLHKPSVERANFAVLRNPDVPSILVETAFISTPAEERRLRSAGYQNQMADAILSGIRSYFSANPPLARNRPV